ncbi:hypothetical protein [Amycolatopsis magusensis]|jgi:hypothetical protein|uniref:Uncharacterized protein n=1 Tax=Amycolatopsis magusensis TaxID=882444 RepID=A0ABS4PTI6_9PSEU|nr:hypothetical protein [Amycolatopsis magusensis]MBP2182195.1 hypothetical protein [Amycolatopsis magusensis]MDI5974605.1 hypothetical protein [Amycolatopsis magusensis]
MESILDLQARPVLHQRRTEAAEMPLHSTVSLLICADGDDDHWWHD